MLLLWYEPWHYLTFFLVLWISGNTSPHDTSTIFQTLNYQDVTFGFYDYNTTKDNNKYFLITSFCHFPKLTMTYVNFQAKERKKKKKVTWCCKSGSSLLCHAYKDCTSAWTCSFLYKTEGSRREGSAHARRVAHAQKWYGAASVWQKRQHGGRLCVVSCAWFCFSL